MLQRKPTADVGMWAGRWYSISLFSCACAVKIITRFLDLFGPNLPGAGIRYIIPGQGEFG